MKSLPFYAILFAHMGQNYGYETLMTELPTYMKQVLRFTIKEVSLTLKIGLFSNANKMECTVAWNDFKIVFSLSSFSLEWYIVSSSILGYVDIFNVHLRCRRLDDLFGSLFTHRYTQTDQFIRYVHELILVFLVFCKCKVADVLQSMSHFTHQVNTVQPYV